MRTSITVMNDRSESTRFPWSEESETQSTSTIPKDEKKKTKTFFFLLGEKIEVNLLKRGIINVRN